MKSQEKIWDLEYKKNNNIWKKEVPNLPNIFKNKTILELGVGNGKTLYSILIQKPKKVIAADFSSEALNISKIIFEKERNVRFVKASALSLPIEDNFFDIVVCRYILNNLKKKEREKAVKEMHRVLKKDGKIIFEDFSKEDFRYLSKNKPVLVEKNTIIKENGMICHFFEKEELDILFSRFSKHKVKKISFQPIKLKPNLKRSIFTAMIEK